MKLLIVSLAAVLMLSGCEQKPEKLWTVIDSTGKTYTNLRHRHAGWGWDSFTDSEGRIVVVQGNYSYRQQRVEVEQ